MGNEFFSSIFETFELEDLSKPSAVMKITSLMVYFCPELFNIHFIIQTKTFQNFQQ